MVGSAAAAFARDISAELVKVLGCVPVSVLLAFRASTECPPCPSNQLVHRNDYQNDEHDSDSLLDLTCSEVTDYRHQTKE